MTLVWRPGYGGAAVSDPDAQAYLQAVEVADNQALEQGVQQAVNQFVIGCKTDGIWSAIKASCILAGARTLNGCLVPLVGTAPTNNNFVSGDYNRRTGLLGASSKYLNSNRNNNADPQNDSHNAVFVSEVGNNAIIATTAGLTGSNYIDYILPTPTVRLSNRLTTTLTSVTGTLLPNRLVGSSRNNSTGYTARVNGVNTAVTANSSVPENNNVLVYARNPGSIGSYATHRFAFYSIGESLNLAKLDTRVTALITAIGAAIP